MRIGMAESDWILGVASRWWIRSRYSVGQSEEIRGPLPSIEMKRNEINLWDGIEDNGRVPVRSWSLWDEDAL
jgi:hypothetical protein